MKTIFRYTNIALLVAAVIAVGAMGTSAQDPCGDAEGQTNAGDKIRAEFKVKTIEGRKAFGNTGKAFLEKYGACESAKDMNEWLKIQLPRNDKAIKDLEVAAKEKGLVDRFNAALNAKNWDEVYVVGKEVLAHDTEKFRAVELVLGSIGYDELFKGNAKYNDETLRYAKIALNSLESGKTFSSYGVNPFTYKSKDDAIAWMNLTIGYITQVGRKDKVGASSYLFKATQASMSDTSKNPIPYELIGGYYFDELNKLVDQIQAKAKEQNDADPPEVAQKKVDEIKALVAMSNGTAERAMDAFSRAYTLGQAPAYKKKMKDNVASAYKVRFAKEDGVDAWISSAVAKPFVNPTTPVQPITDPEPVKTTGGGGEGAGNGTGTGTGVGGAKPAAVAPTKSGPAKPSTAVVKPGIKN